MIHEYIFIVNNSDLRSEAKTKPEQKSVTTPNSRGILSYCFPKHLPDAFSSLTIH